MIQKIPADQRYYLDHGWLKTYHLFSFADYYDPDNVHFGDLRVFNDDTIGGNQGFGAHSHSNMEIVTLVFQGQLTHRDSLGNAGIIKAGEVQYMSAGTGVTHAELNDDDKTVHLYQIWILPRTDGLAPKYEQKDFTAVSPINQIVPVASGYNQAGAISIEANASIYTAMLESGTEIDHTIQTDQGLFIYVKDGDISINGEVFKAGDQARITDEKIVTLKANRISELVLIETSYTE
jgi:quercetin 2,3-dioxygenase